MILAKLSGLQKIFTPLQAVQYLPLKKFSLSRCLLSGEETANRFLQDKVNASRVMAESSSKFYQPIRTKVMHIQNVLDWTKVVLIHRWETAVSGGNVSELGGVSAKDKHFSTDVNVNVRVNSKVHIFGVS